MTRTGKIARLPHEIRARLNRRLQDGEPGIRLVEWLNKEPKVQEVLAGEFGGRAVSEQNLSEWKQGGYQEWVRHDESCEQVRRLTERAEALEATAEDVPISNHVAAVLAAELASMTEQLLEPLTDPKERWQCLREVLVELRYLRQEDHNARRVQIQQERWQEEQEQREQQEREVRVKKSKDRLRAQIWAPLMEGPVAKMFGGGEHGQKMASLLTALENDLPLPDLETTSTKAGQAGAEPVQPNQTESGQIRPNQTNGDETA